MIAKKKNFLSLFFLARSSSFPYRFSLHTCVCVQLSDDSFSVTPSFLTYSPHRFFLRFRNHGIDASRIVQSTWFSADDAAHVPLRAPERMHDSASDDATRVLGAEIRAFDDATDDGFESGEGDAAEESERKR